MCVYVYLPVFGVKEMLWGKEVQEECIIHMFGNVCVNWAACSPGSFYMCTHTYQQAPPQHLCLQRICVGVVNFEVFALDS